MHTIPLCFLLQFQLRQTKPHLPSPTHIPFAIRDTCLSFDYTCTYSAKLTLFFSLASLAPNLTRAIPSCSSSNFLKSTLGPL